MKIVLPCRRELDFEGLKGHFWGTFPARKKKDIFPGVLFSLFFSQDAFLTPKCSSQGEFGSAKSLFQSPTSKGEIPKWTPSYLWGSPRWAGLGLSGVISETYVVNFG